MEKYKIVPRKKDYQQMLVRVSGQEVHKGVGKSYGWYEKEYVNNMLVIGVVGNDRWTPVKVRPIRWPSIQIKGAAFNIEFEAEDDDAAFEVFKEHILNQRDNWDMRVYNKGGDTRPWVQDEPEEPFDLDAEFERHHIYLLPWEQIAWQKELKRMKKKIAKEKRKKEREAQERKKWKK